MLVRTTLIAELSEQCPVEYAAGWGNDEVLHVDTGTETGCTARCDSLDTSRPKSEVSLLILVDVVS